MPTKILTSGDAVDSIGTHLTGKKVPRKMRRWVISLEDVHYRWLKETSTGTGVKGSAIVRTLIESAMRSQTTDLKSHLVKAQLVAELRAVQSKKAAFEEREAAIQSQLRAASPAKQARRAQQALS